MRALSRRDCSSPALTPEAAICAMPQHGPELDAEDRERLGDMAVALVLDSGHRVGSRRPFDCGDGHGRLPPGVQAARASLSAMVPPSAEGLRAMVTPASCRISTFSSALSPKA